MGVIAEEIQTQLRRGQESGQSEVVASKLSGEPMTETERHMCQIFNRLAGNSMLRLQTLRDRQLLGARAMSAKQLTASQWSAALHLADNVGFGRLVITRDVSEARASSVSDTSSRGVSGRSQTNLQKFKRAELSEGAIAAAKNMQLSLHVFPATATKVCGHMREGA